MQSEPDFKLSLTLTLAAFGSHYISEVLPPITTPKRQAQRKWKVRKVCSLYREYLQREPLIGDLEKDAVLAFVAWMKGKPQRQTCFDFLRTLRKQAIDARLLEGKPGHALLDETDGRGKNSRNGRPGRKPGGKNSNPKGSIVDRDEGEEGSLWWYCRKRFFPGNLAIRHPHTKLQYKLAIDNFQEFLGRTATPADLSDDNIVGMMKMLADRQDMRGRKMANTTINGRRDRLRSLWEWMARKKITEQFPTVGSLPEPKRLPKAWTQEQLAMLFDGCRASRGLITGVPASLWWESLHLVGWDTAERIGALLAARWEHLDIDRRVLTLPAEIRKGGQFDASYTLHVDTVALLLRMKEPQRDLIWPWPLCLTAFHLHYRDLLQRSGLPHERGVGFHKMRRSVASHLHAGGHNASEALGHSSSHVTKGSYLDPSIAGTTNPARLLFRPANEQKPVEALTTIGRGKAAPLAPVAPAKSAQPVEWFDDMPEAWL